MQLGAWRALSVLLLLTLVLAAPAAADQTETKLTAAEIETLLSGRTALGEHRGIATRQFQRSFVLADGVEVAELHAPYPVQEILLKRAFGLDDDVRISPSGGAFAACTPMVAGLVRIGEAAMAVRGGARAALGHATSGVALQHNLVCVLEA